MATRHYEVIVFNEHGLRIDGYPVVFPKCREGLAKAVGEAESLVAQGFDPQLISVNYRDEVGNGYPVYDVEWGWDDDSGTIEEVDAECDLGQPIYNAGNEERTLQEVHSRQSDEQDFYNNLDPHDMDGDFDSGMTSAGFGTDEDYGYFGGDETYGADF